jgi:hypothetical protein
MEKKDMLSIRIERYTLCIERSERPNCTSCFRVSLMRFDVERVAGGVFPSKDRSMPCAVVQPGKLQRVGADLEPPSYYRFICDMFVELFLVQKQLYLFQLVRSERHFVSPQKKFHKYFM